MSRDKSNYRKIADPTQKVSKMEYGLKEENKDLEDSNRALLDEIAKLKNKLALESRIRKYLPNEIPKVGDVIRMDEWGFADCIVTEVKDFREQTNGNLTFKIVRPHMSMSLLGQVSIGLEELWLYGTTNCYVVIEGEKIDNRRR